MRWRPRPWPRSAWLALAIAAGLLVAPWYLRYALFAMGAGGVEFVAPIVAPIK